VLEGEPPVRRLVLLVAVAASLTATERPARAMSADGMMITNFAAVTGYWRSRGPAYEARYTLSYNATAPVRVTNPCTTVQKTVTPAYQTPGGTLTYSILVTSCAVSSTSWNVVAEDALPDNVAYNVPHGFWGSTSITPAWSTDGGTNWTSGSSPAAGQGVPLLLRWVFDHLAPDASAFVSYTVTIK
jgi:uncharacterized repeat protein (TIGR01451 family)